MQQSRGSSGAAWGCVLAALAHSHPSRAEARPADGRTTTRGLGVWPTQACLSLPAGQSQQDKGAANTCRSWPGCRFSLPKRLQLPTVTGIKLPGPDGSPKMEEGGAEKGWARGGGGGRVGGHEGVSWGRKVGMKRGVEQGNVRAPGGGAEGLGGTGGEPGWRGMERELEIEKDQVSDWVGDFERAQRKRGCGENDCGPRYVLISPQNPSRGQGLSLLLLLGWSSLLPDFALSPPVSEAPSRSPFQDLDLTLALPRPKPTLGPQTGPLFSEALSVNQRKRKHCRDGWVKGWVEWMAMRTEEMDS